MIPPKPVDDNSAERPEPRAELTAQAAPLPPDEAERLAALQQTSVLDTPFESVYDDLTHLAATLCEVPIALISLVDESRQWFKSSIGLRASETPREQAFCAHAILSPDDLMEVPDASQDPRFAGNPLVTGSPHIRFYAGSPILSEEGLPLGTLCVIDRQPRQLTPMQQASLRALARVTSELLRLRRQALHHIGQTLESLRTESFR